MELLELKSVWNVVIENTISEEHVDEFVVAKSIKKDSKSLLNKIKRVMYLKFFLGGLTLMLCTAILVGSFIKPESFTFYPSVFDLKDNRLLLVTIVVFMTLMLSWNFRAFREINRFETTASTIKESLGKFIRIMEKTIQLNVYFGTVFNTLAFGWIFYIIINRKGFLESNIEIVLMTALVMVVGAILSFFISHFEQKLKFGNYLNQLKSNLKDLDEY
ncbi:MAG: hypothetical protein GW839_06880 [Flavobacteriales bacterium]|nr:hypothetical protein [Flavobacteriales bacterium]PIV95173.1 MAG: hypothetical protein COW44_00375 [Flavobacteriaceae bacterium CG17_big_fil_post_rev_8_21_14_2_50_33_15]